VYLLAVYPGLPGLQGIDTTEGLDSIQYELGGPASQAFCVPWDSFGGVVGYCRPARSSSLDVAIERLAGPQEPVSTRLAPSLGGGSIRGPLIIAGITTEGEPASLWPEQARGFSLTAPSADSGERELTWLPLGHHVPPDLVMIALADEDPGTWHDHARADDPVECFVEREHVLAAVSSMRVQTLVERVAATLSNSVPARSATPHGDEALRHAYWLRYDHTPYKRLLLGDYRLADRLTAPSALYAARERLQAGLGLYAPPRRASR
jgi:hypothetical protein